MATTEPITAGITADDLERMELDDRRVELIGGTLVEMTPTGERHSDVGAGFVARLWLHAVPSGLGRVYGADAGFVLFADPHLVRVPDAAFVRADRLPPDAERDRFLRLAPDLVVEVVSPSDRPAAVTAKAMLWLDAGTRLVWVVDPCARTVTAYGPDRSPLVLREGDVLDGGEVLPGFRLAVADLFAS